MRLDTEMVRRGLLGGRERAKEAIAAGLVLVDGKVALKPSMEVVDSSEIKLIADPFGYVSRGGVKLEKAFLMFQGFSVMGKKVMDIGASTGGFTDCLLKNGAAKVWAIDVGTGQLNPALRADPRVICMEGKNARDLTKEEFDELPDGAVMDVSFISVKKIIPKLAELLPSGAFLMTLLKPQFEAGKASVGKHGVVKSPLVHEAVLRDCVEFIQKETDFVVEDIGVSPIQGQNGNIEFLLLCRLSGIPMPGESADRSIRQTILKAHSAGNRKGIRGCFLQDQQTS